MADRSALAVWLTRLSRFYCIALAVVTLGLAVAFRFVGEANAFTALLVYLPFGCWFLTLVPATVAVWFYRPGWVIVVGAIIVQATVLAGYVPGAGSDEIDAGFVVLTNNRGDHGKGSLKPFIDQVNPHFMVLQDCSNGDRRYARDSYYVDRFPHMAADGEFTLLSRYPILSKKLIPTQHDGRPKYNKVPIACRFVVDGPEGEVVIYNVHLMTPRDDLKHLVKGGAAYGLLGWLTDGMGEKQQAVEAHWRKLSADAQTILEHAAAESGHVIVAGDFNLPGVGAHMRRARGDEWLDAHLSAGSGTGNSVPGVTRNPLSLFGPWMRIDYILVRDGVEVTGCVTESGRESQHRAVAAGVKF